VRGGWQQRERLALHPAGRGLPHKFRRVSRGLLS
jgi:hypothetical protein